jgi:hypothetical protein
MTTAIERLKSRLSARSFGGDQDEKDVAKLLEALPELLRGYREAVNSLTISMLVMDSEVRKIALECVKEHRARIAQAEALCAD